MKREWTSSRAGSRPAPGSQPTRAPRLSRWGALNKPRETTPSALGSAVAFSAG
ncbi:predicted protein [Micromonas commoda]|uniref:Uncharacterized protein n=1 Tax=Micromonas commoda (strain RCC299 / NOUM17 / CCMP2709) TaxID=296587 RepID=C1DZL7_MICCC|nr:predicted protein [Micromonas commoda]ACO60672.1 predicted protein [Micromonas commoda]|eukprot:XP_002499413.1 predicted protein [Micromonas commoda]